MPNKNTLKSSVQITSIVLGILAIIYFFVNQSLMGSLRNGFDATFTTIIYFVLFLAFLAGVGFLIFSTATLYFKKNDKDVSVIITFAIACFTALILLLNIPTFIYLIRVLSASSYMDKILLAVNVGNISTYVNLFGIALFLLFGNAIYHVVLLFMNHNGTQTAQSAPVAPSAPVSPITETPAATPVAPVAPVAQTIEPVVPMSNDNDTLTKVVEEVTPEVKAVDGPAIAPIIESTQEPTTPIVDSNDAPVAPIANAIETPVAPAVEESDIPVAPITNATETPIAPIINESDTTITDVVETPAAPVVEESDVPVAPTTSATETPIAPIINGSDTTIADVVETPVAPVVEESDVPVAPTTNATETPIAPIVDVVDSKDAFAAPIGDAVETPVTATVEETVEPVKADTVTAGTATELNNTNNTSTKKKKPIVKIVIAAIVAIAVIVGGIVGFSLMQGNKSVDISLMDNVSVTFFGTSGEGYAEIENKKFNYKDGNEDIEDFLDDVEFKIDGSKSKLENGDKVKVIAVYDKEWAKDLNLTITNTSKKFTVKDLDTDFSSYDDLSKDEKEAISDAWDDYVESEFGLEFDVVMELEEIDYLADYTVNHTVLSRYYADTDEIGFDEIAYLVKAEVTGKDAKSPEGAQITVTKYFIVASDYLDPSSIEDFDLYSFSIPGGGLLSADTDETAAKKIKEYYEDIFDDYTIEEIKESK